MAEKRLDNKFEFKPLNNKAHYTAMCFPGVVKFFINTEGKFSICEKIHMPLHIGDVDKGFDFDMIKNIHRQWNNEIIRNKCWECPVWFLCNVCLAQNQDENKIKIECSLKHEFKNILTDYIKEKEERECNKEENKLNNISDYIHQL